MMIQRFARSVTWKVNITVLFCILCIMTLLGTFSYLHQKQAISAELQQNVGQIGRRIEHTFIQPAWEYDYAHIQLLIELEMEYPHISAILYKERGGEVKAGKIKGRDGNILDFGQFPDPDREVAACFDVSEVTIRQGSYLMGTVLIGLHDRLIRQQLQGVVLELGGQFLLVSAVLYMSLFLILRLVILRPISTIDRAVLQLAAKDFRVRIPSLSPDELGRLATSFNQMAETIVEYSEGLEEKVQERTRELEEANLYQTRFFANISHEFRTPLTLILAPLEAIFSGTYGQQLSPEHPVFHTLYQNASRLLHLINNILDLSKIDAGKAQVQKTQTEIARLLELYVSTIKAATDSKNIQILFHDNTNHSLSEWIDQDLFEKAVFNLLSNAFKFTPGGGHILVQLDERNHEETGPEFLVSVKDTGVGIPPEQLDQIFDRFQQLRPPQKREKTGTGIGLALTREIMQLHQGTIEVKSSPGKGSTFTLIFPCQEEKDLQEPEGIASENDAKTVRAYLAGALDSQSASVKKTKDGPLPSAMTGASILVVDDAPDMRQFLRSILEQEGYEVVEAMNGRDGLERALSTMPDLLIVDVMMPEMNGYEMVSCLREHPEFKGVPIIFVSARAEENSRIRGFEQGGNDYVVKPFHPQELQGRVKANLEMKMLRDCVIQQKQELEEALNRKMQAYQRLEETERHFRQIADLLPSAVAEIDLAGKLLYLNQAGREFFEISADEVVTGQASLAQYVKPEERERFEQEIQTLLSTDESPLSQYTFLNSHRQQHVALLKGTPAFHESRISGLRLVIVEVHASLDLLTPPAEDFYEKYQLTNREKEILEHLIKGLKNKEIGEKLYITEITVKKHVSNILQKTGSKNRSQLLALLKNDTGGLQKETA